MKNQRPLPCSKHIRLALKRKQVFTLNVEGLTEVVSSPQINLGSFVRQMA
jgi:hypothetical protein